MNANGTFDKLSRRIEQYRDEMVDLQMKLCAIPAIAQTPAMPRGLSWGMVGRSGERARASAKNRLTVEWRSAYSWWHSLRQSLAPSSCRPS